MVRVGNLLLIYVYLGTYLNYVTTERLFKRISHLDKNLKVWKSKIIKRVVLSEMYLCELEINLRFSKFETLKIKNYRKGCTKSITLITFVKIEQLERLKLWFNLTI